MNIANRGPMGQKEVRPADDPEYLDLVRGLPCIICQEFGETQLSPTEAHHCIHNRYSQEKVPDREAIPLCNGHHTGDKDPTKTAIHRGKKTWLMKYGADREYIARTHDELGV